MAEAKRDANRVPTILGVDNGDLTTPAKIAVDPATGRMLVTAVVTAGATTATEYTEGDVDASFSGVMLLGEAPGNVAKPFAVDADGNLQIDATLSGVDLGTAVGATENSVLISAIRDDALSALADAEGDAVAFRTDANGALWVIPSGTVAVSNAGLTELAGAINASAQVDVNLAGSGITVAISHAALTELAAAIDTEVQVDVVGALPAGANTIGRVRLIDSGGQEVSANGAGYLDVEIHINDDGTSVAAGVGSAGSAMRVALADSSAVGIEANSAIFGMNTLFDADGDNTAQQVKGSSGNLYMLEVSNPTSADAYLQLFNLAAVSVTVGTTTPKLSFLIPAGDGTKDGAMDKIFTVPIEFSTAISYACTTTATGSGDPATGMIVNIGYA